MADPSRFRRWWPTLGLILWAIATAGSLAAARALRLSPGETVLAGALWLLALALASRAALRNLFGPVFAYDLLRLGRRRLTFLLRFLYCLLIVGLLALFYGSWMIEHAGVGYADTVSPSALSGFANSFFETLAIVQFTVAALLTPAYVAGTIADEKERKTLEFLLATDLESREIVFGKLAARVTNLLMYVLAGVPIIAFLQLFGGIDPEIALAAAAATALLVLGLSALSILFSVLARKPRDAIAFTYGAFFLYLIVSGFTGPLANWADGDLGPFVTIRSQAIQWTDLTDWFVAGNPLYTVPVRTNGGQDLDADVVAGLLRSFAFFWGGASALCLLGAVLRLRPVALKQKDGPARKPGAARAAALRPEVGDDPILWREVFAAGGRAGCIGWFFRAAVALMVAVPFAILTYESLIVDHSWRSESSFAERFDDFRRGLSAWVRGATGCLSVLIFFGAALRGAASIAGERDRDTWISLIAAPLSPEAMLRGKFLGAISGLRFFWGLIVAVWAIGLAAGAIHILSLVPALLHLLLYTSAFALLGMFCSIGARTTLIASIRGFVVAFFFTGGFWIALGLLCGMPMSMFGVSRREYDFAMQFGMAITPPLMSGFWPMPQFDRENAGPFSPDRVDEIGPMAPVIGSAVWLLFTLLLAYAVHGRLTAAMNRHPKRERKRRGR